MDDGFLRFFIGDKRYSKYYSEVFDRITLKKANSYLTGNAEFQNINKILRIFCYPQFETNFKTIQYNDYLRNVYISINDDIRLIFIESVLLVMHIFYKHLQHPYS